MIPLFINGKFTAQSVTGVQRVALELVQALDELLAGLPASQRPTSCVLLCPPQGTPPALRFIRITPVGWGKPPLQLWEQLLLPLASSGGRLLNLSGSAPMWAPGRSVCLLHDAAVFDHPDTYTWLFRSWYRWLFRWLSRHAAGLMTVSEFSRGRLSEALQTPAQRFLTLRNGADHFSRLPQREAVLRAHGLESDRYLLVVGTAKSTKNVSVVLDAWRDTGLANQARLVWVGGQNPRVFAGVDQLHREKEADRSAGILHVGFVSDAALKALYSHAAGLVFPSRYEGFGLPVIEAMVCGCPVAAARAASLPEVCGEAALLFDPDDRQAIGDCMQQLLNDASLRERLRQAGLAHSANFRWAQAARSLWAGLHCGADLRREMS